MKTDSRPVSDGEVGTDRRTRDRVARTLLEQGPSTAAALGARLGLTPAAIRRHLDALLADGSLVASEPRVSRGPRGRGRPARLFALSDRGHASMGNGYEAIAAAALRYLGETGGAGAVASFARARIADLETRYSQRLTERPATTRPQALAEALSADGYAATTRPSPAGGEGIQICQHHCPVQHVAEQFPAFCDAETEAFGRLLGTHVQRLATIAHGDGVCTTHVPLPHVPLAHVPLAHVPLAHVPLPHLPPPHVPPPLSSRPAHDQETTDPAQQTSERTAL